MSMTLEAAAQAFRDAMRDSIKRHSLWYLIEGCCWSWLGSWR